mmetsp:Transcript_11822/g.36955  ORF Transcript_11822/g.36955 Transcript_11822/m.36955 type:complete len:444 (-) Transcript_11822:194-1525(-)
MGGASSGELQQPLAEGAEASKGMSLRLKHVLGIWNKAEEHEKDSKVDGYNFFDSIYLAKDGGVNDIQDEKLLYSMQYIKAMMSVLFIIMNTVYVTHSDFDCVFRDQCLQHQGFKSEVVDEAMCIKTMITTCDVASCIDGITAACKADPTIPPPFLIMRTLTFGHLPAERMIAFLEFFGLWMLIGHLVLLALQATFASMEVFRWVCVMQIFWNAVPSLSAFSLMRLLYFVVPAVIGTEAYYIWTWMLERMEQDGGASFSSTWLMARYVISRLLCLIIGFDAFLMKFRLASSGLMNAYPSLLDVLAMVIFLFQVMGVVNLTWFVRERLFLFIFGSEDGGMNNEQKAREIVWNARMAHNVYHKLGVWKFILVMLGFDDYDFQVLVMEEKDENEKKQAEKKKFLKSGMKWPWQSADEEQSQSSAGGLLATAKQYPLQAWLLNMAIDT